jgi:hypothetical protein
VLAYDERRFAFLERIMKVDLDEATLSLDRLNIVKLRGAKGACVTCRAGVLWITQEGVPRDDLLPPGSSVRLETDGVVLIEALCASSATLRPGGTAAHEDDSPALEIPGSAAA